jgi:hypothetical protein
MTNAWKATQSGRRVAEGLRRLESGPPNLMEGVAKQCNDTPDPSTETNGPGEETGTSLRVVRHIPAEFQTWP